MNRSTLEMMTRSKISKRGDAVRRISEPVYVVEESYVGHTRVALCDLCWRTKEAKVGHAFERHCTREVKLED